MKTIEKILYAITLKNHATNYKEILQSAFGFFTYKGAAINNCTSLMHDSWNKLYKQGYRCRKAKLIIEIE